MNKNLKTIGTLGERATLLNNGNDIASDFCVVHKSVGAASSCPQGKGICTIYRGTNGITLIALIVTIIVLLILAMTSVSLVLRNNLIEKAQLAKDEYEQAAQTESDQLNKLENALFGSSTGGNGSGEGGTGGDAWVDNEDGTFTKGDTTVEIGETTFTNAEVQETLGATGGTYTGTWTVIGVEGDKLKLVSTTNVNNSSVALGKTDQNVYKKDAEGNITTELKDEIEDLNGDEDLEFEKAVWSYANAVNTLNEEAKKATGITSAESITIEDIYDIIGEENVDKNSSGSYGAVYNYYFDIDKSKVCSKKSTGTDENGEEQWGSANTTSYATQTFVDSEGRTVTIDANNPDASVRLSYDYFSYTLTDAQKSAIGSLATGYYWLASPCVNCLPGYASFHVRSMRSGYIRSYVLFYSNGSAYNVSYGVRAVVSI